MASYKVEWKQSAFHNLRNVDKQYVARFVKTIERLSQNPFPRGCKKLVDTERTYRISIGDYRVVYQVEHGAKVVYVVYIRHRKDVYRRI